MKMSEVLGVWSCEGDNSDTYQGSYLSGYDTSNLSHLVSIDRRSSHGSYLLFCVGGNKQEFARKDARMK